MTVWTYDQSEVLKVFATEEVAQAWLDENDPEGVTFEHDVIGPPARTCTRRTGPPTEAALLSVHFGDLRAP